MVQSEIDIQTVDGIDESHVGHQCPNIFMNVCYDVLLTNHVTIITHTANDMSMGFDMWCRLNVQLHWASLHMSATMCS